MHSSLYESSSIEWGGSPYVPGAEGMIMLRALVIAWSARGSSADSAPSWLPASLRLLQPVTHPGTWEALLAFFQPGGGGSESYRIALDPTCVHVPKVLEPASRQ